MNCVVLLMWKCMGPSLMKNYLLRCRDSFLVINCTAVFTVSLLLKYLPRKLEPWFTLGFLNFDFFLLRLLFISINPPCGIVWSTVVMCWLVRVITNWISWISCGNGYIGLLTLNLLLLFDSWLIVEKWAS